MKKTDILAVNPGSTSTKVGVYRSQADGTLGELFVETINLIQTICWSLKIWKRSCRTVRKLLKAC